MVVNWGFGLSVGQNKQFQNVSWPLMKMAFINWENLQINWVSKLSLVTTLIYNYMITAFTWTAPPLSVYVVCRQKRVRSFLEAASLSPGNRGTAPFAARDPSWGSDSDEKTLLHPRGPATESHEPAVLPGDWVIDLIDCLYLQDRNFTVTTQNLLCRGVWLDAEATSYIHLHMKEAEIDSLKTLLIQSSSAL